MCDDGGYLFCSLLKDSSWELVRASSFILVEIFQLFNYSVCANIKGACWSTIKDLLPE